MIEMKNIFDLQIWVFVFSSSYLTLLCWNENVKFIWVLY